MDESRWRIVAMVSSEVSSGNAREKWKLDADLV
jgi:hypothetical protein